MASVQSFIWKLISTPFYDDLHELEVLNWQAIAATDWRDPIVKERKQSEFLVEESFPWGLIERIGVIDNDAAQRVAGVMDRAGHKPDVVVMRNWYY